ncbi:unnamed protein product [Rotaria socialis]|uniref:Uncharacterized protein n=1 Tax=Rotaria socialis TaxID=392032 RepID=A0A820LCZ8_9BILA|nr:unnamed protein product [Rotaria socialis]
MTGKYTKSSVDISNPSEETIELSKMINLIDENENIPLLSLDEAINPLRVVVPELEQMVLIVRKVNNTSPNIFKIDESHSILLCTMKSTPIDTSFRVILNNILQTRNLTLLKPWLYDIKLLMTALSKLTTNFSRITVYRATLVTLEITWNEIGDDEAKAIAYSVQQNKMITTLDLQHNLIGPQGAQHLAKILTAINLENNHIGDEGAQYFANALRLNKTLTALSLANNRITTKRAQHFVNALQINKTLTTLDLQSNEIGPIEGQYLANALEANKVTEILLLLLSFHPSLAILDAHNSKFKK